jgi:phosphate transport system protein
VSRLRRSSRPTARPQPAAVEHRPKFRHDLEVLEEQMRAMAALGCTALELSVQALLGSDVALCEKVIADDDRIDVAYQQIERHVVDLMGRQQPVASDLRLLVGLLHMALHLERIGDMAVDIAAAARSSLGLPASSDVLGRLREMGDTAISMTDQAVDAFIQRDQARCEQLAELDDRIDDINRGMIDQVLSFGDDPQRLEWALRMLQVSRYLDEPPTTRSTSPSRPGS